MDKTLTHGHYGEKRTPQTDPSANVTAMMLMMNQIQQQYANQLQILQEQFGRPVVEPPPEIKRRMPVNAKLRQQQIKDKLAKDMDEERRKRITLANTVYSEFSLLDEAQPTVLKGGLLQPGEKKQ